LGVLFPAQPIDFIKQLFQSLLDGATPVQDEADVPLAHLHHAGIWTDLVIAVVAIFTAVFAGLQAVYFDKTFGSGSDYVAIFLLSATVEAALTGVMSFVGRLRST